MIIGPQNSQPGTLTLGLESSYLERIVIPSSRIPCDDSIANPGVCPPQVFMKWTGHSDYKSMKPYIDIATRTKSDAMAKIAASWEEED